MDYRIRDESTAPQGRLKVEWAEARMPVLALIRRKYGGDRPFEGLVIGGAMHVTKETAVLVKTLKSAGAEVYWASCNPLSTQDDVAAAMVESGIPVYAWHGMSREEYYDALDWVLDHSPHLLVDDGGDLIFRAHEHDLEHVIGGTEETTTGIHRLRAMADAGILRFPIIAVNDAETKWDFDNVYGTGQSSLDGILRSTAVLLAGKRFVVAGYGHCGRGVAMRARGMGAQVIVTEVDPIMALKAVMEGFRVMSMDDAARIGDIFITATGMKDVIVSRHFNVMKDGAIVCNTGHYDCEINVKDLEELAVRKREIRSNNEEFTLEDGRRIYLLAKGRLVNLAAAEGHPSEVMDMSFANQFIALLRLAREGKDMDRRVYDITRAQDEEIASLKLQSMGISIDMLSEDQRAYLTDYSAGT